MSATRKQYQSIARTRNFRNLEDSFPFERTMDRVTYAVIVFGALYFGVHVLFWAVAGFPVR